MGCGVSRIRFEMVNCNSCSPEHIFYTYHGSDAFLPDVVEMAVPNNWPDNAVVSSNGGSKNWHCDCKCCNHCWVTAKATTGLFLTDPEKVHNNKVMEISGSCFSVDIQERNGGYTCGRRNLLRSASAEPSKEIVQAEEEASRPNYNVVQGDLGQSLRRHLKDINLWFYGEHCNQFEYNVGLLLTEEDSLLTVQPASAPAMSTTFDDDSVVGCGTTLAFHVVHRDEIPTKVASKLNAKDLNEVGVPQDELIPLGTHKFMNIVDAFLLAEEANEIIKNDDMDIEEDKKGLARDRFVDNNDGIFMINFLKELDPMAPLLSDPNDSMHLRDAVVEKLLHHNPDVVDNIRNDPKFIASNKEDDKSDADVVGWFVRQLFADIAVTP